MREGRRAEQLLSIGSRAEELVFALREHGQEVVEGQLVEPRLVALEEELAQPELLEAPLAADRENASPVRTGDPEALPSFRIEGDLDACTWSVELNSM